MPPPKIRAALRILAPFARSLLEQVEQVHRALQLVIGALNGRDLTNLDVAGSLALQEEATAFTIASGVIDVSGGTGVLTTSQSSIQVDTESAADSDILHTINGGRDGMILILRATNTARTIVVENGTGNIILPADVILDTDDRELWLRYNSTLSKWIGPPKQLEPLKTITSGETLGLGDLNIFCDASGGAFTVSLPPAASALRVEYYIVKIEGSANAVTVDPDGSETINGALTFVLGAFDSINIMSDGTQWIIK